MATVPKYIINPELGANAYRPHGAQKEIVNMGMAKGNPNVDELTDKLAEKMLKENPNLADVFVLNPYHESYETPTKQARMTKAEKEAAEKEAKEAAQA